MENNKDKKKKPLKLSSSGRLQIRKNLGPSSSSNKNQGTKSKTIQIVFRNKNNQQKRTSTTQSTHRGSSSFRTQANPNFTPNHNFSPKTNKNFNNKNKKSIDQKKTQPKRTTLKPIDDDFSKVDIHYVGSIAFYLKDEITKIGKKYNLKTGKFIQRPIIGLVDYHKRNILD